MADIRVFLNQGRYDNDPKKVFVIRKNAVKTGNINIQDAAEQRIKNATPNCIKGRFK
ncbi:hypothetical protein L4D15_17000 [Enterovibrio norvegicus]|uniref:hypothetical protein n=1 Tax=Enterovibrio norvegicus TaxID=188144 RepID=UPI003D0F6A91